MSSFFLYLLFLLFLLLTHYVKSYYKKQKRQQNTDIHLAIIRRLHVELGVFGIVNIFDILLFNIGQALLEHRALTKHYHTF